MARKKVSLSSNHILFFCIFTLGAIYCLFVLETGETSTFFYQSDPDLVVITTNSDTDSSVAESAATSPSSSSSSASAPPSAPPTIVDNNASSDHIETPKDDKPPQTWRDLLTSGNNLTWDQTEFLVQQVANHMPIMGPLNDQRYAVINRHYGCHNDLLYLSKELKISFAEFNTEGLFAGIVVKNPDFITENEAKYHPKIRKLANQFCDLYSHVIVADINPDAKFLLQRILESPETCKMKRLIMYTTNRFDYVGSEVLNSEKEKYWRLIKKISLLKTGPEIVWIQNNPVESEYAKMVLGGRYMKFETIRPFGFSTIMTNEKIPDEYKNKVVARETGANSDFFRILKKENIDVTGVSSHYGGPAILAQYKAYIELPYQFSTMKQYENLAHGVITLLPSPPFFMEMWNQRKGHLEFNFWGFQANGVDPARLGREFYRLSDYYHDDLKMYYYYFDSFDDLKTMLQRPEIDTRNIRQRGKELFQKWRREGVEKWRKLLSL